MADAGKREWDELTVEYGTMLMEGLSVPVLSLSKEWAVSEAAGAKHVNVLQHLMGYLKNHLSSQDKAYLR